MNKNKITTYDDKGKEVKEDNVFILESDDCVLFVDGIEYHVVNGEIIEVDNHIGLL